MRWIGPGARREPGGRWEKARGGEVVYLRRFFFLFAVFLLPAAILGRDVRLPSQSSAPAVFSQAPEDSTA